MNEHRKGFSNISLYPILHNILYGWGKVEGRTDQAGQNKSLELKGEKRESKVKT